MDKPKATAMFHALSSLSSTLEAYGLNLSVLMAGPEVLALLCEVPPSGELIKHANDTVRVALDAQNVRKPET